jgi:hypothetical protein
METKKTILSALGILPNGMLSTVKVHVYSSASAIRMMLVLFVWCNANRLSKKMKRIGILLLFVLTNSVWVDAQGKYRFTINPEQDTVIVYDAQDNVVLMYGKDIFVYRQTPIKVTKDKKEIIFSSRNGELGRVSSKKYRKIYLADGSTYALASGKRKLSYKKDGRVCASSGYSYSNGDKVDVEMSVDTDLNFIPFLFQSVLAHIQGTREAEQLSGLSVVSLLF